MIELVNIVLEKRVSAIHHTPDILEAKAHLGGQFPDALITSYLSCLHTSPCLIFWDFFFWLQKHGLPVNLINFYFQLVNASMTKFDQ